MEGESEKNVKGKGKKGKRQPLPPMSVTEEGIINLRLPKTPKPSTSGTSKTPKKAKTDEPLESPPPKKVKKNKIEEEHHEDPVQKALETEITIFAVPKTETLHSDGRDITAIAVDEIALEGLDGITLEALWKRMSKTLNQPLPLSDWFENYIWKYIQLMKDLEFYQLKTPRAPLVIYDRFSDSPELKDGQESSEDVDIYPFVPINDKNGGIVGSCSTYYTRKKITGTVKKMDLEEAKLTFGNKLVIVASQTLRSNALVTGLFLQYTNLHEMQYYVLERIGRSRRFGELTCGTSSLIAICKDSKTLFYYRKALHNSNLITKQSFYLKGANSQYIKGNIFHLTRFFTEQKSKKQLLVEWVVKLLQSRPGHRMEYNELKEMIGTESWEKCGMSKLIKSAEFRSVVTIENYPYRFVYPDAKPSEWKSKSTAEKNIKMLELSNPDVNVNSLWKEDEPNDSSEDEDSYGTSYYNMPVTKEIYDIIYDSGRQGVYIQELHSIKPFDFYMIRSILKYLVKQNLIYSVKVEAGRQRYCQFCATCFKNDDYYNRYLKQKETQTIEQTVSVPDETMDFIAGVLNVNPESLKGPPVKEEIETETDEFENLKGKYDYIQKLRNKPLKIRNCDAAENNEQRQNDKKILDEFYTNKHGYFDNHISEAAGLIIRPKKKLHIKLSDDFSNVLSLAFKVEPVESSNTLYHDKISPNQSKLQRKLQISLRNEVEADNSPKQITKISKHLKKLYIKTPNDIDKSYKKTLSRMKNVLEIIQRTSNEDTDNPSGLLSSDEEDLEDINSLDENIAEGISFKKEVLNLNEIKAALIQKFEEEGSFSKLFKLDCPLQNIPSTSKAKIQETKVVEIPNEEEVEAVVSKKPKLEDENISHVFGIKLEQYMGRKPDIILHEVDKDNVEIKVITSAKPENFGEFKGSTITDRIKMRTKFITDLVEKHKVIHDICKILHMLTFKERKEGYIVCIDRRSLYKIYSTLAKEGVIVMVKVFVRYETVVRSKTMIAYKNVDIYNVVTSALEQFRMSFFIYAKRKVAISLAQPIEVNTEEDIAGKPEEMKSNCTVKYKYSKNIGKTYGFYPKIARIRVLHEFLYYLIRGYNGKEVDTVEVPQILSKHCDKVDQTLLDECSTLYKTEASWKMFVPSLPKHKNWSESWFLICDVLLRLPLSIYVKIFNVVYIIPELNKYYLNHPVRKHFLVKNLPADIRDAVLGYRKYIFSIHEVLCYLCYMGLVQFGPQKLREKDQHFVYLNHNAVLYDTTSSDPGYHHISKKEYPIKRYTFDSIKDVEKYWADMFSISMNTKLGQRQIVLGKYITLEKLHSKPEILESLKPQTQESVQERDVGYLPGDKLGACCSDSAFWLHFKRNWIWSTRTAPAPKSSLSSKKKSQDKKKRYAEYLKQAGKKPKVMVDSEFQKRVVKQKKLKQNTNNLKAIVRKVKPRKSLQKKIRVDGIDKKILEKLGKSRAVFCEEEDKLILLCRAVVDYLCPNQRKRNVVNSTVRDFIHRILPYSRKTSAAYKRRYVQLKKNSNLPDSKQSFAFNLNADYFTQKHFKHMKNKISNSETVMSEVEISLTFLYLAYYTYKTWKATPQYKNSLDFEEIKDYLDSNNLHRFITSSQEEEESIYQNPKNEDDVNLDTIKSVIHSSLGCQNASDEWPYKLLKVYQSFSESLLRDALNFLRDQQLISGKKANTKHSGGKDGSIVMCGTSYHLSFVYTFKQITKYPSYIYNEADAVYAAIQKNLDEIRKEGRSIENFEQGHGMALIEIATIKRVIYRFDIPEDIIAFDPAVEDHTDLVKELALRYKAVIDKSTQDNGNDESQKEDPELYKRLETFLENFIRSVKESGQTKDVESDFSDIFGEGEQSTMLERTLNSKHETPNNFGIYTDRRQKGLRISDLAYFLTKGLFPELDDDDKLEKLNKHFLVKYPTCKFFVEEENIDVLVECNKEIVENAKAAVEKLQKECIIRNNLATKEEIDEKIKSLGGNVNDETFAQSLIDFINSKDIYGATCTDIKETFKHNEGNLPIETILVALIRVGVILRVGVCNFAFVHFNFRHNWTIYLDTKKNPNLQLTSAGYRLRISPWIKIDGTIHFSILDNWLSIILSHCMSYPYVPFRSLCTRFCYIKPIDLYKILEILQEVRCLKMLSYQDVCVPDLFSEVVEYKEEPATIIDNLDDVFVETDQLACTKFGAFLNRDEDNYNFSFLE